MHFSFITLSLASTALALVSVPLDRRAIGGSCTTPVRSLSSKLLNVLVTKSNDRTEQEHASKLPIAQPRASTSRATVQALRIYNAASRRAAAPLPAPASA